MTATETGASTQTPEHPASTELTDSHTRWSWLVGMMIVLLIGVGIGLGVGRFLQDDADSESSYVVGNTVVSGGELTERQAEMVRIAGRYVGAWIANDGDAVASFMVPDGYVSFPTLADRTVRAEDGTLQDWVGRLGQIPNEMNDPIIVDDNRVVLIGQAANLDWMIDIEFTTSGDVLIVSDTHWAF